jgi:flagellar basal-body rod protein FlgB
MDGNSVVLEEEMMKMSDSQSDYDTAATLYEQAMNMIRTAVAKPSA